MMYIESIELKDFRNYKYLRADFDRHVNILHGDNAQGKTNVLEAVYLASTSKSHRAIRDDEMIRLSAQDFNEGDAHIKIIVSKEYSNDRIDIHLKKNKPKGIAVNGIPLKKSSDLFGILQVVFFNPEDLDIVRKGPAVRRHFIDIDLGRVDNIYLNDLMSYNRLLDSRNKLLKKMLFEKKKKSENNPDVLTLNIIDEQLISYAKKIIKSRNNYLSKINSLICIIHSELTEGKEKLILRYEPSCDLESLEYEIKNTRERDIKNGSTGVGPHRDDFLFLVNDMDVKKYGSQGQKRTAALSLKLAQIDIAKSATGELPVLLLDDVFSELDLKRKKSLINRIGDLQTLITCTGQDEIIKNDLKVNKMFKVIDGIINEEIIS